MLEGIRKRNEKHRELVNFYRSSDADTKNNKDIGTHVFEMKHITDKSIEDKDYLFSLIDKYKSESGLTKRYLVLIGGIARRQDNIYLQEISQHVSDILESLEKE